MHHTHISNYEQVEEGFADRRIFEKGDAVMFRDRTREYIDHFRELVRLARLHDKAAEAELDHRFHFRFIRETRTFA